MSKKNIFKFAVFIVLACFGSSAHGQTPTGGNAGICDPKGNIAVEGAGAGGAIEPATTSKAPQSPGPSSPNTGPGAAHGVSKDGELVVKVGPQTATSPSSGNGGGQASSEDPTVPTKVSYTPGSGSGGQGTLTIEGGTVGSQITLATSPPLPSPPAAGPGPVTGPGGGGGGGGLCDNGCPNGCPEGQTCQINPNPNGNSLCICVGINPGAPQGPLNPDPAGPVSPKTTDEGDALDDFHPLSSSIAYPELDAVRASFAGWADVASSENPKGASLPYSYSAANYPNRGGDWFTTSRDPVVIVNVEPSYFGEEMIWYLMNGSRIVWQQLSDGSYRTNYLEDAFGSKTEYVYSSAQPGSPITEIISLGSRVRYQRQGNTLNITQELCRLDYTNCTQLPEHTRQLIFNAQGKVVKYISAASEYLNAPLSGDTYDLSNSESNRVAKELVRDSSGKVTEVKLSDEDGNSRTLFTVTWSNNKVQRINYSAGDYKEFSYSALSGGGTKVTVTQPTSATEYDYDSAGNIIKIRTVPNTVIGDAERWAEFQYLSAYAGCPLVSVETDSTGGRNEYFYDDWYRTVTWGSRNPANDSGMVYRSVNLGHPLDGSPELDSQDEAGHSASCQYVFGDQSDPTDARRKLKSKQCSTSVTRADGVNQTYSSSAAYNPDGTTQWTQSTDGVVTRYTYEAPGTGTGLGLLLSTVAGTGDAHGNVATNEFTTYARREYDAKGRVVSEISGPSGAEHTIKYKYDIASRVSEVADLSSGAKTNFYYTWDGGIAAVTKWSRDHQGAKHSSLSGVAAGKDTYETHYTYNNDATLKAVSTDSHRAPYEPSSNFLTTRFFYDPQGRLVAQESGLGIRTDYQYNDFGDLHKVLQQGKVIAEYVGQGLSSLKKTLASENNGTLKYNSSNTIFNRAGVVRETTSADGKSQKFNHDPSGNVVRNSVFQGTTLLAKGEFKYDELGRLVEEAVFNPKTGGKTVTGRLMYGKFGLEAAYDQFGLVKSVGYDALGRTKSITLGDAKQYIEYYPNTNNASRVGTENSPGNVLWASYEYYPNGSVKKLSVPGKRSNLVSTHYKYDSLGNPSYVVNPLGHKQIYSIGLDGFTWYATHNGKLQEKNARIFDIQNGKIRNEHTDIAGRNTVVIAGANGVESVTEFGQSKRFEYDGAFKLKKVSDALGSFVAEYDEYGRSARVTSTIGSQSVERWVERDPLGRVGFIKQKDGSGLKSRQFQYGDYSEIKAIIDDNGAGARVTSWDRNINGTFDFNRIHKVTVDGLTKHYQYHPINRHLVTAVSYINPPPGVPSLIQSLTYRGVVPEKLTLANGAETVMDYSDRGLLKSVMTTLNSAVVEALEYERDDYLRITKEIRSVGSPEGFGSAYFYNDKNYGEIVGRKDGIVALSEFGKAYRLISASSETSFEYDKTNPLELSKITTIGAFPLSVSYKYDKATGAPIEVTRNGVTKLFEYDARGNMLSNGVEDYVYGPSGYLKEVLSNGQSVGTFDYDLSGNLLKVNNETHRWLGGEIFSSEDNSRKTLRNYYPGVMNEEVASYDLSGGVATERYKTWGLYSPLNSFEGGQQREAYAYDVLGASRVYASGSSTPQASSSSSERGFDGHFDLARHNIPLHYARARFYNAEDGLATQRDPLPPFGYSFPKTPGVHDKTGLQAEAPPTYSTLKGNSQGWDPGRGPQPGVVAPAPDNRMIPGVDGPDWGESWGGFYLRNPWKFITDSYNDVFGPGGGAYQWSGDFTEFCLPDGNYKAKEVFRIFVHDNAVGTVHFGPLAPVVTKIPGAVPALTGVAALGSAWAGYTAVTADELTPQQISDVLSAGIWAATGVKVMLGRACSGGAKPNSPGGLAKSGPASDALSAAPKSGGPSSPASNPGQSPAVLKEVCKDCAPAVYKFDFPMDIPTVRDKDTRDALTALMEKIKAIDTGRGEPDWWKRDGDNWILPGNKVRPYTSSTAAQNAMDYYEVLIREGYIHGREQREAIASYFAQHLAPLLKDGVCNSKTNWLSQILSEVRALARGGDEYAREKRSWESFMRENGYR